MCAIVSFYCPRTSLDFRNSQDRSHVKAKMLFNFKRRKRTGAIEAQFEGAIWGEGTIVTQAQLLHRYKTQLRHNVQMILLQDNFFVI